MEIQNRSISIKNRPLDLGCKVQYKPDPNPIPTQDNNIPSDPDYAVNSGISIDKWFYSVRCSRLTDYGYFILNITYFNGKGQIRGYDLENMDDFIGKVNLNGYNFSLSILL